MIDDGNALWQLVSIKNLIDAILLAAEKEKALRGTYIIAYKDILSINDIFDIISDPMGIKRSMRAHMPAKFIDSFCGLCKKLKLSIPIAVRTRDFF